MLRSSILVLVLMAALKCYSQPSLSPLSVIYPCSDDEAWIIGGTSSINKEYRSDSVFSFIDILPNARIVSHSYGSILVLDNEGRLFGRGVNIRGDLGLGDTLPRAEFDLAESAPLFDTLICDIQGAYALSIDSGKVYHWGFKNAELFRDTDHVVNIGTRNPTRIFKDHFSFSKISLGNDYLLLLRSDGALYGFGGNEKKQLGEAQGSYIRKPTFLGLVGIKDIYAGESHSLALDSAGHVFCFGSNIMGQCGVDPDQNYYISEPTQMAIENVVSIAANKLASYAVTASGEVFAWGMGLVGGMGNGDSTYVNYEPQKVLIDSIRRIWAKDYFVISQDYNNDYFGWGQDPTGVFGLNKNGFNQYAPIKLPTQCLTTDISELSKEDALLVYPNPSANGVFNLSKASSWIVFNSLGQVIAQGKGAQVDLSSKSDGFYFLRSEGNTEALVLVKKNE